MLKNSFTIDIDHLLNTILVLCPGNTFNYEKTIATVGEKEVT